MSNTPTHLLKMKSRDPEKNDSATIGVGWMNNLGGISLYLNKGVMISWRDLGDQVFMLWPNTPKPDQSEAKPQTRRQKNVLSNPDNASSKPPPLQDH